MRSVGFQVIGPDNKAVNQLNPPSSGNVMPVIGAQTPGNWTLTPIGGNAANGDEAPERLGFSVNASARESELAVMESKDLEALLGKDRFAIAQGPEDLERATSERRIGQELFPWLMVLILALITAESFLANTFYRQANDGSGSGAARAGSASPSSPATTAAA